MEPETVSLSLSKSVNDVTGAAAETAQLGAKLLTHRHLVGENIHRYPMSLTSLERQVSELVNSDTCPRPTTQVNVHLDGTSCHKQHHDIYSIAQRAGAGRDCTVRALPGRLSALSVP